MLEISQRIAMKAVIPNRDGKVLVVQVADTDKAGPNAGRWGLPGGKLKVGEQWEIGLKREVREETGLHVEVMRPLQVGEWRPIVRGKQLQIVGVFFECVAKKLDIKLSHENSSYKWIGQEDFYDMDVMQPDSDVASEYVNTRSKLQKGND